MYELQTRLGVIVNTLMELTCSGVRVVFFLRVATKVGTWPSYSNICFSSISRFRFFYMLQTWLGSYRYFEYANTANT